MKPSMSVPHQGALPGPFLCAERPSHCTAKLLSAVFAVIARRGRDLWIDLVLDRTSDGRVEPGERLVLEDDDWEIFIGFYPEAK